MKRLEDAPGTDSFEAGRPDPELAAKIGGPPMRKAQDSGYQGDVEVGNPLGPTLKEALAEWRESSPPARSAGVIMVEQDGRIWFCEPKDHFDGNLGSLPKGRVDPGETEQQAALREVYEESGLTGEITAIVGSYLGTVTVTTYYLARRMGGAPWAGSQSETWSVKLAEPEDAAKVFKPPFVNALRDAGLLSGAAR